MNVGIIGGTDGLGKTLIYYFKDEFDVYITGRDHKKGKNVADELNVNYIESNEGLANISDMLIISVPILPLRIVGSGPSEVFCLISGKERRKHTWLLFPTTCNSLLV